jgi:hypothetical protein
VRLERRRHEVMELRRVIKEHSRYRTLVVEEGEVVCPRQGVVDLELC